MSLPLSELSITKLEEVVLRLYNDNQCKLVNGKMFCKGKNVQPSPTNFHPQVLPYTTTLRKPTTKVFSGRKPYSQELTKNR